MEEKKKQKVTAFLEEVIQVFFFFNLGVTLFLTVVILSTSLSSLRSIWSKITSDFSQVLNNNYDCDKTYVK